ncbi:MAG: CBS domain-containing protein [Terriglobales bacterium]|jgi:CBS domain-containing protein
MHILTLCTQESITVPPDATVAETIKLMLKRRVGAVVVVHGKLVQGIFTERDVLKKVALSGRDPAKTAVSEVMTTPVLNASPKTTPGEALGLMLKHHFRHLPVVDLKGRLKGVLSIRDLMHEQMEEIRRQHHSLEHYVSSEREGEPRARDARE